MKVLVTILRILVDSKGKKGKFCSHEARKESVELNIWLTFTVINGLLLVVMISDHRESPTKVLCGDTS